LLAATQPPGWAHGWIFDEGRGLNAEIFAARQAQNLNRLVIIHADLPLLSVEGIAALTAGAADGWAIAPDRHGTGTNALALTQMMDFTFVFGPNSFARHLRATTTAPSVVQRTGLAIDIDTQDDLDLAAWLGFSF